MDVQMLNIATGETIHEELGKPVASNFNALTTQVLVRPSQKNIVVTAENEVLNYSFSGDPTDGAVGDAK